MTNFYYTVKTFRRRKKILQRLIIKKFPSPTKKVIRRDHYYTNNKEDYEATEKCVKVLSEFNNVTRDYILNNKANLYCPLHEDPKKSKSKSGKLWAEKNLYACFSKNCKIPRNKNGNCVISTFNLFKMINQK